MIDQETRTAKVVKFLFLGLWLVITVFPLYWIVVTSFKKPGAIFSYPLTYWPEVFSIENYLGLFSKAQFGTYVLNSLILAFLATQMIPSFIALGPLYLLMTQLKLVDNRFGLILIYIAVCIPFCTVMLRGFFENIPDALEEAAMIDGCSRFGALFRVLVPVLKPGIVAAFIFNFVNCWNELFLSVTLINSDANKTIPTALNGFITSYNIDWGSMSAAAVLTIIPTMVLFAFASRYIVQGLTSGAVKG
jgi:multiple sugar transport system permease protein